MNDRVRQSDRIRHYPINTEGRDYVIGDIHGHFSAVERALDRVKFNYETDRLFSVGDLVDRGPESLLVAEWLHYKWFHPVRGNHDQMTVDSVLHGDRWSYECQFQHGGEWLYSLSWDEQKEYAYLLDTLPYAIEVDTQWEKVGIVHADVPFGDWNMMKQHINDLTVTRPLMWSRSRIDRGATHHVANIDVVFVGHSPVEDIKTLGNVVYMDLGVCFNLREEFEILRIN